MNLDLVAAMLKEDEGYRAKPYHCPAGKLTIGYGRNIEDNGITQQEAEVLLKNDVIQSAFWCQAKIDGFDDLSEKRQAVLVNMCFNLGWPRFSFFVKFFDAIRAKDWERAALEMRNSRWAKQVGDRAERLAKIMEGRDVQG